MIRYFSLGSSGGVSTLLPLQDLQECNDESITRALLDGLSAKGLNPKNLVGTGVDNASIMPGVNSSVNRRLWKEIPNLVMVCCVCHSRQLVIPVILVLTLERGISCARHTNGSPTQQPGRWSTGTSIGRLMMVTPHLQHLKLAIHGYRFTQLWTQYLLCGTHWST